MEHRWGERFAVELAVRLHSGSTTILDARLLNASVSGTLINTNIRLSIFSHVIVEFDVARRSGVCGQRVPAYVVRHALDGRGGVGAAAEAITESHAHQQRIQPCLGDLGPFEFDVRADHDPLHVGVEIPMIRQIVKVILGGRVLDPASLAADRAH